MPESTPDQIQIRASRPHDSLARQSAGAAGLAAAQELILTPEALKFVLKLHQQFEPKRQELLQARTQVSKNLKSGWRPSYENETAQVRDSAWTVAKAPLDLQDRRVEITGPVERKMMINALNSGAKVFMADFEDANSPTWSNVIEGQQNCYHAVRRELKFVSPEGKVYSLNEKTATLVVRPRGWHLAENHLEVGGKPLSASLVDFGLYFFHNAKALLARESGPYFYLPKLESHLEARLWNDVFNFAQDELAIPRGTIRATVLIETILAAFEMEEILFELREHAAGLNAGRWDYLFSTIKKFADEPGLIFPDRAQLTMTVPFMRAYTQQLVHVCHKHGAHAIGGMAAFIPSRKDAEVNAQALSKVREDKTREAGDGFDGTWVAHPDLVPIAREAFDKALGTSANQKHKLVDSVPAEKLLPTPVPGGQITEAGVINNISVALQYMNKWLQGVGAVAIFNLMEDAATAEIARAELWQWVQQHAKTAQAQTIDAAYFQRLLAAELAALGGAQTECLGVAAQILSDLVLKTDFEEFLTIPAYQHLRSFT